MRNKYNKKKIPILKTKKAVCATEANKLNKKCKVRLKYYVCV